MAYLFHAYNQFLEAMAIKTHEILQTVSFLFLQSNFNNVEL